MDSRRTGYPSSDLFPKYRDAGDTVAPHARLFDGELNGTHALVLQYLCGDMFGERLEETMTRILKYVFDEFQRVVIVNRVFKLSASCSLSRVCTEPDRDEELLGLRALLLSDPVVPGDSEVVNVNVIHTAY